MNASDLDAFALEARRFTVWAESDSMPQSPRSALKQLTRLYQAALDLDEPDVDELGDEEADVRLPEALVAAVASRAAQLPQQNYWEVFDPTRLTPDEPVCGDLRDDITDIYKDVARGLALFDRGQRVEAQWFWAFNFRIHWSEHVTSAIRAIDRHVYYSSLKSAGGGS
jgi:hypothetical protein